jgi:hypothetical protein
MRWRLPAQQPSRVGLGRVASAWRGRCGLVRPELLIRSIQSWIMNRAPTDSTERTQASHKFSAQLGSRWWLARVAHAGRSTIYESVKGIVLVR